MYKPPVPWEEVRRLALPDLAITWLSRMAGAKGSINPNNAFAAARAALGDEPQPDGDDLLDRLSDAWAWLEAHGFIGYDPRQTGNTWMRVTALGAEVAAGESAVARVWAEDRLPGSLDPELMAARTNVLMGEYETAAFAAMKAVEVQVRSASGLPSDLLGVSLMRRAFHPESGPLRDADAEAGEREATAALFAGAIGAFKNPASHRAVTFEDAVEVIEIVMLADLLLRIVRRRQGPSNDA